MLLSLPLRSRPARCGRGPARCGKAPAPCGRGPARCGKAPAPCGSSVAQASGMSVEALLGHDDTLTEAWRCKACGGRKFSALDLDLKVE
jgi:hypothetical protein